jgi:hypothetical protein
VAAALLAPVQLLLTEDTPEKVLPDQDCEKWPFDWEEQQAPESDIHDGLCEKLEKEYEPLIITVLEEVRKGLHERGFTCDEVYDMSNGDEHGVRQVITVSFPALYDDREPYDPNQLRFWEETPEEEEEPQLAESVDISIEMTFATPLGETGPTCQEGVTFRADIVCYGGRILGEIAPFNYTPECFVDADDEEEVRNRWDFFKHWLYHHDELSVLLSNYLGVSQRYGGA